MANHEFGIIQNQPMSKEQFYEYEPNKYSCIAVDDNFIEPILIDKNAKESKEDDFTNVKAGDEIAIINIPSIKLNTVVVESIEKQYLNHYVCHFENTAMPGEYGNFSLAGHSSYRYNEVFNELHKINLDDEIIIKTLNNEFTYVVKDIFEVNPEDTFVLDQDNEIKELTIVTCTNKGKDRLIVKAEIVEDKNNK